MQICALPIAIVSGVATALCWIVAIPLQDTPLTSHIAAFIAIIAIIPFHELLHFFAVPRPRKADAVLGFWPKSFLFYMHVHGELSRNQFLLILLTPLLVISLLPLAICAAFKIASPLIALLSTINALLSCGDLFACGLVLFQIPSSAFVRNQGWRTFWRT